MSAQDQIHMVAVMEIPISAENMIILSRLPEGWRGGGIIVKLLFKIGIFPPQKWQFYCLKRAFRPWVSVYLRNTKSLYSHTGIPDSCVRAVSVYTAQLATPHPPTPPTLHAVKSKVSMFTDLFVGFYIWANDLHTRAQWLKKCKYPDVLRVEREKEREKTVSLFLFWHLRSTVCFIARLRRCDSVCCGHERYSMFTDFQTRRRSGSGRMATECLDNWRPSATRRRSGQARVTSSANRRSLPLLRKNWPFSRCKLSHTPNCHCKTTSMVVWKHLNCSLLHLGNVEGFKLKTWRSGEYGGERLRHERDDGLSYFHVSFLGQRDT